MVGALAFSADGKHLLAGDDTGEIRSWDLATGKARVVHLAKDVNCLALSGAGDRFATWDKVSEVVVWDAKTGKELRRFRERPERSENGVSSMQFSPDGKTLATAGNYAGICLWDMRTGKLAHQLGRDEGYCGQPAFAPDGKMLACDAGKAVRLWDTRTGQELLFRGASCWGFSCLAFAPDGKHIAWGGLSVRITDTISLKEIRRFPTDQDDTTRIVFAPDGKSFVTEAGDHTLRFWETASGRKLRAWGTPRGFPQGEWGEREITRVTPDLRRIIAWHMPIYDASRSKIIREDLRVSIKDAATGKPIVTFRRPKDRFGVADVSPAGDLLALAGYRTPIIIQDAVTGDELFRIEVQRAEEGYVHFSPAGWTLLEPCGNGDLSLWELASGRERLRFKVHPEGFFQVVCSADGRLVASWAWDAPLCLWDLATGQKLKELDGHRGGVHRAAFSPDGSLLATANAHPTGLLWDLSGLREKTLPRPTHLADKDLEHLRVELGAPDAAVAWRAILKLESAGGQAVPYLAQCLPARRPTPEEIAKLIGDLDSRKFAMREKAERELAAIFDLAEQSLRRVLKGGPTLEVRRRIERLLDRKGGGLWRGRSLQVVRAIEALERIGTTEARQALKELATSKPEDRLTREAKAALGRLARK
jgi:WD40 repeat protein